MISYLPSDHVSAFVDIRNTIEEALNASEALAHDRLGVVPIVEILSHLYTIFIFIIKKILDDYN